MKTLLSVLFLAALCGCAHSSTTTEAFLQQAEKDSSIKREKVALEGLTPTDAKSRLNELANQCFSGIIDGGGRTYDAMTGGSRYRSIQSFITSEADEEPGFYRVSVRHRCTQGCAVDGFKREGEIIAVMTLDKAKTPEITLQSSISEADSLIASAKNWMEGKKKTCIDKKYLRADLN